MMAEPGHVLNSAVPRACCLRVQILPNDRVVLFLQIPIVPYIQYTRLVPHHFGILLCRRIVEGWRVHLGDVREPLIDMRVTRHSVLLQTRVNLRHALLELEILCGDVEKLRQESGSVAANFSDVLFEPVELDFERLFLGHQVEFGAEDVDDDCVPCMIFFHTLLNPGHFRPLCCRCRIVHRYQMLIPEQRDRSTFRSRRFGRHRFEDFRRLGTVFPFAATSSFASSFSSSFTTSLSKTRVDQETTEA
uniref:Uncharacterized protein n=1 Tax=Cacopsylla melanoneura TaxID=428564 RepID=A0A8D8M268_9HEMI